MACNPSVFTLTIEVHVYPYAQCSPPGYTAGCLKPGSTAEIYINVVTGSEADLPTNTCHGVTVAIFVNGSEIGRKDLDVNPGYRWQGFGYLETTMKYVIPDYGTYNFCGEIVSVR